MSVDSERLTFQGATGETLAARLDRPPGGADRGYVLFAHCFTCSKDVFAASRISKSLADHGFGTLRFDFTGLGHSDGEFGNTNFSSNVADLVAAADFMRDEYEAPSLLIGHSLGGAAVLAAAAEIDEVDGVTTIGAPMEPDHIRHLFHGEIDRIREEGVAEVTLAGRTFRITEQFLEDLTDHGMEEKIGNLKRPLLIFHSPVDDTVGIDNAARIYKAAKHPKSFVSLDDADHLLTDHADARYVATVLSAWATRYVGERASSEADEAERPNVDLQAGQVYVGETGEGKFSNHVLSGEHYTRADEPESFGGDDTGMSPYEFVTAGLGACTSMTLRMYADRKGWPVDSIEVRLTQDKIHADDCDDCDKKEGKIDRIERRIRVTGDLDDEQRQRLVEIADKCPVHKTLTRSSAVVTTLDEGG